MSIEGGLMNSEQTESQLKRNKLPASHILLVDDEPLLLDMSSTMLMRLGCTVDKAENGYTAIDIYKEKKDLISAVILDISMPGLSGKDTYHELKKINPEIKVILASGISPDADYNSLLSNGAAGFIQKPYRIQQLYEKLAGIL